MAKKIRKAIIFLSVLAVIGLMVVFNWPQRILEVEADDSAPTVTVGNATAAASSVTINGGSNITLTENTTKNVIVTGTVTDDNSCKDLASVKWVIYKQGTTCAAVENADNDNCYFYNDASPSTDASCTGNDDTTYATSTTFAVQYYADGGSWEAKIFPSDEGAGTAASTTAVTLNALQSLDVSTAINYGSVSAGSNSTGDKTATVTDTGNVAIDVNISGTAMTCDVRGNIPVGNQEYATSTFSYGAGTDLTAGATPWELELNTPEHGTVPITDITYWQVGVPAGVEGTCPGTNTFTATAD